MLAIHEALIDILIRTPTSGSGATLSHISEVIPTAMEVRAVRRAVHAVRRRSPATASRLLIGLAHRMHRARFACHDDASPAILDAVARLRCAARDGQVDVALMIVNLALAEHGYIAARDALVAGDLREAGREVERAMHCLREARLLRAESRERLGDLLWLRSLRAALYAGSPSRDALLRLDELDPLLGDARERATGLRAA